MDYLFKLHILHKSLIKQKLLRQSKKEFMDSEELLYTEFLPTLNSLPHFKFNEFVPKSHNYWKEEPQNSGLLILQSIL